ncbi:MAG: Two component transcriptional regulator, winged helix family [Candidatus Kaiserbacteria bacterium GW2011_GWB1_52_6]|uniref:Two component transcriptional regulator, winged helix family n=2 Tax=Candidatus Kaiseribacteriota TaxID=1752734 RepID=A0A0G2A3C9_9BACT|nr:MAG: Two component transcriptional regulator, winged helix family [Candidatus Kaiserbacteria bacterium GW2011_GWA2_52_12]KKW26674.1 MAG: Two component transcriptional regulator, winged helix family [Candidatus Kaiserbacteria bacterium GW2011_GWB1_52_6]
MRAYGLLYLLIRVSDMKILLVEDEQKLAAALTKGLSLEGYTVDAIGDGKKAMTRISLHRGDYDVIILDLMLPSMDGLAICKQAREAGITTPILILTARAETDTKVELLSAGADDYLIKPFSFAELVARLQALLRRPVASLPETLKIGEIELSPGERKVVRDGKEVPLTLKEFGLLEYFMRHPNQVVNREDLLNHLWDFNYVGFSNVVDVHIKNLRRKLGGGNRGEILETVRGIGYRLAS